MESVKINALSLENIKRVKAVRLTPAENGLTVVGGRNNQGKTSVLDAIAWALGGERFRPTDVWREGSVLPPSVSLTLSNGLVVERSGKNGVLKVTDPSGTRYGQKLLDEFVETFALDLPRFMQSNAKDKANVLLKIIGVGDKLAALERQATELYNRRLTVGQIADRKRKAADEMPHYIDTPAEPVSISELIRQQQDILAKNGENQRFRMKLTAMKNDLDATTEQITGLEARLAELYRKKDALTENIAAAEKTAAELNDESTAELEKSIANIELINAHVRANLDREKAEMDAKDNADQYDALTVELEGVRLERMKLLDGADMPLKGLSVADGELTFNGKKWDCMSSSEQLRAATAIVRRLNPACGFVLLDKLEQLDAETLRDFGAWLEVEGLQAIATRVSTGDECSIIIDDGVSIEPAPAPIAPPTVNKTWEKGVF